MSSRDAILSAIRRASRGPVPLPEDDGTLGVRFDDPRRQFAEMVESVGGTCIPVTDRAEADEKARAAAAARRAEKVASVVPGVG
ncbi:MAG TPA: hypothetical protein VE782_14420, partial [Myxococcaceae bacterium]|nr:hypothetical protein [Myxococcaceae bacterium]